MDSDGFEAVREVLQTIVPTDGRLVGVFATDGELTHASVDAFGTYDITFANGEGMRHAVAMYIGLTGELERFDDCANFVGILERADLLIRDGVTLYPGWMHELAREADEDEGEGEEPEALLS